MIGRLLFSSLVLAFPLLLRAEVVDIGNAELARLLAAGVPVIDIRTAGEWRETGVVPSSRLLTLFDERGRADAPAWLQRVQGIAPADEPVIVICRSGNRTRTASQILSQQGGYRTVYNVRDGIRPWIAEGRALAPVSAAAGTACPTADKC